LNTQVLREQIGVDFLGLFRVLQWVLVPPRLFW